MDKHKAIPQGYMTVGEVAKKMDVTAMRKLSWSSTIVTLPHGSGRSRENENPTKKSR